MRSLVLIIVFIKDDVVELNFKNTCVDNYILKNEFFFLMNSLDSLDSSIKEVCFCLSEEINDFLSTFMRKYCAHCNFTRLSK